MNTETQQFVVILENSPGVEMSREECLVTAEPEKLEDAVEEKILEVLSGWNLRVGDTVRIVEAP